jgi:hypothetical protein
LNQADISGHLIHLTKGSGPRDCVGAFWRLQSIINDRALHGGTGYVRGKYPCVCLSEAPLRVLARCLTNQSGYTCYSPFGVIFDKRWVCEAGGEPVLYEPEREYELLEASRQWLHVRYEPTASRPIDFTWEREWRICCRELRFEPGDVWIVVPTNTWRNRLIRGFYKHQDSLVEVHSTTIEVELAVHRRENFPWRVVVPKERHVVLYCSEDRE